MKFVTAGKGHDANRGKSENNYIETIDFRIKHILAVKLEYQFTMRTSVSFEQFIYNGEFDPGSG